MPKSRLNFLIIVSTLIFLPLLFSRLIVFGSKSGKWFYPYLSQVFFGYHPPLLKLSITILILSVIVYYALLKTENIYAWFIIGSIANLILRSLSPFSPGKIIKSYLANSYYTLSIQHSAFDLLANFQKISAEAFFHLPGNMPGKTLFFHFLRLFTASPEIMGYLIIFISNLGAILVYYIAFDIIQNKKIALYSAILYLFFPSRIIFLPILNTISPLFILLAIFLLLRYFYSKKIFFLLLAGVAIYLQFIFEPLPLAVGLVIFAFIVNFFTEKKLSLEELVRIIIYPLASFIVLFLLVFITTNFNTGSAFFACCARSS
ncbi:hypothetical protein ACFL52_03605 [Candidatus Margulisiibacteriota bacterium]